MDHGDRRKAILLNLLLDAFSEADFRRWKKYVLRRYFAGSEKEFYKYFMFCNHRLIPPSVMDKILGKALNISHKTQKLTVQQSPFTQQPSKIAEVAPNTKIGTEEDNITKNILCLIIEP